MSTVHPRQQYSHPPALLFVTVFTTIHRILLLLLVIVEHLSLDEISAQLLFPPLSDHALSPP